MDYTDLYDFQTTSGVIVPNDASVLEGIQTKFQEIFGTDINLSAETPVGRLIEAMAIMVKTTLGVTAQSANQFNVNEATGIYLDSIGQMYNLSRIPATKSRINLKCYFSTDTLDNDIYIGAGSLIMSGATGDLFRTDYAVSSSDTAVQTEEETGRTYVVVSATAVKTGPIVCPAGTINSIQTGTVGWVGATTDSMIYIGTDLETDESFRQRILKSRPVNVGFTHQLESSLNKMNSIYSSCIMDNNTGFSSYQRGVSIPSHSIFVAVDFIETDSVKKEIAEAIAAAKPVGVGMTKRDIKGVPLITYPVTYGYGDQTTQDIYFYKAIRTAVNVNVSYYKGNYIGTNIKQDIIDVVSQYMDTVGVGGTVYGAMISNALSTKLNIGINSVYVEKGGNSKPSSMKVEMSGYETPYSISDNISFGT